MMSCLRVGRTADVDTGGVGIGDRQRGSLPQFKAINTLLGNLKTALTGTYHAFDFAKYAHRYIAEIV